MKTAIIYKSIHHKNTEKVAGMIANVLNAELLDSKDVNESIIARYDLVGFGSGIYFGNHHKSLLDIAERLPPAQNKKAFIFSTSGMGRIPVFNKLNDKLKKILMGKGFEITGEFSCRGFDTYGVLKFIGGIRKGRPDERDLRNAAEFAKELTENFYDIKNKF